MRFSLPDSNVTPIEAESRKKGLLVARLTGNHYEMGRLERQLGCRIANALSDSGTYAKFQSLNRRIRFTRQGSVSWKDAVIRSGIIFIHIPKAAGTSICHAIYGCKSGDHRSIRDYQCALTAAQL